MKMQLTKIQGELQVLGKNNAVKLMLAGQSKLTEFEGYFRSQEFIANALGLRSALKKLDSN